VANVKSHHDLLSPPETLAPVVVGGIIVAGSAAVAIAMLVSKTSAQNKATDIANQISQHGGTTCSPTPMVVAGSSELGNVTVACAEYQTDNKDVNTDATIGNIALGVGVIAAVGTIVYWLVADRRGDSPSGALNTPVVTPMVGRSSGGLSLSGSF
jgi:hypothetical protein